MDRRTFMKLLGGLASMPIIGRIAKPLKSETVREGIAAVSNKGMELYEMVIAKVMKEGTKVKESNRIESYKHPDRPDITVDVNQMDGSAEVYFDTDKGSKGYAKIDRDMETGGDDLIEAEEVFNIRGDKDIEEGIRGGIENLDEFTRVKKNIGGQVQPYDPRASVADFTKAINMVGAGTDMQKARAIQDYGQSVQRQNLESNINAIKAAASVPYNFAKGILGNFNNPQDLTQVSLTQAQKARLNEIAKSKGTPTGNISYADSGSPTETFSGIFPKTMSPLDASLALTMGGTDFRTNPEGEIEFLGGKYNFEKGSNPVYNFIDRGGIAGAAQRAKNLLKPSSAEASIPVKTLPVEPRTDQDLIEGFEKFKQLNPDSLSGTGIAALIEGTLPDGTPITFSGGAESSAFNEYLESLGLSRADIFTPNAGTDRPTMADVAGPSRTPLSESDFYNQFYGVPFEGFQGKAFRSLQKGDPNYDEVIRYGQTAGGFADLVDRGLIQAYTGPTDYKNYLSTFADGGAVDLTIITMPDISGSGVESLFKRR